jgi:hypothetical protein
VRVSDKTVFEGPQAFQALALYVNEMRAVSGAQSNMVAPTLVDGNKGFAVADKSVHSFASADEKRVASIPVGQSSQHSMSVGQVNFSTEEDPRYYQSGKVTEQDVSSYSAMRTQQRQRPVKWEPSVLGNGDMVTM